MRILIAPLNWGLGHATRCIPLIRQYLNEGADVILGGTGESLQLLRKHFPALTSVELAPLALRYSKGTNQIGAMLRALPQFLRFYRGNRKRVEEIVRTMGIDMVVADNCFGVYSNQCKSVYMTHQLHICLPQGLKWLEPMGDWLHARLYAHYDEIWVPDNETGDVLSGKLGHPSRVDARVKYIGPLSRFSKNNMPRDEKAQSEYEIVAVLSGLEPQRTLFEQKIVNRFSDSEKRVLIVRGKTSEPNVRLTHKHITLVPSMDDETLQKVLYGAELIIARSGYSTIMDLWALGLLNKAELHPTPGQSEQEYLALLHHSNV